MRFRTFDTSHIFSSLFIECVPVGNCYNMMIKRRLTKSGQVFNLEIDLSRRFINMTNL